MALGKDMSEDIGDEVEVGRRINFGNDYRVNVWCFELFEAFPLSVFVAFELLREKRSCENIECGAPSQRSIQEM